MKIMIFTDNLYIYENFVKIIEYKGLNKKHDFKYACSIANNIFKEIDNVQELNIKDKATEIVDTFEFIFSCHSKQIFPALLVNNVRCINIHPGLNPYNRGWFPQVFSIINGLPVGVTIHVMDEKIDHGDIIVQEEVKIYESDSSLSVYRRVLKKEVKLFNMYIDKILSNDFDVYTPKSEGNYNSIDDYKNICKIDLDRNVTMREAINYLRAMSHAPYKNCYFVDSDKNRVYVSIELERE